MIWDSCCLLESIRICKLDLILEKFEEIICLEAVYNEVSKKDKTVFLKETDGIIKQYQLKGTLSEVESQFDSFPKKINPLSLDGFKRELSEVLKEIPQFKFKVGDGDREILTFCKKKGTCVITHDRNLSALISSTKKHLYLIEVIIENWEMFKDEIPKESLNYLYYGCLGFLSRADKKDLEKKYGMMWIPLFRKKIKIIEFMKREYPLNSATIIARNI